MQLEREVRAFHGWPQSRTSLSGIGIIVTQTSVAIVDDKDVTPGAFIIEKNRLLVGTAKDWLEIHRLKPAGKKEMPVSAFLSGYGSHLI